MTRKHPIAADDISMWDNPQESPLVRQLLRAGRDDQVKYDVEAGLARHLANLQSGTQLPPWAVAQSTVQKGWSPALLAWLLPPVISATLVGAWLYLRPADTTPTPLVTPSTALISAPASPLAATVPSAEPVRVGRTEMAQPAINVVSPAVEVATRDRDRDRDIDVQSDAQQKARAASPIRGGRHAAVAHRARTGTAHLERDTERSHVSGGVASATPVPEEASGTTSRGPSTGTLSAASPAANSVAAASVNSANASAERRSEPAPAPVAPAANERREPEPQAPRDTGISDARLEREMQMLAVAQRVLTSDPERSLRLTRQGEQEFRGSMFSAERTQVSLLALVQLGRVDEARRLGAPFLRAYPNAPWSARLRQALASGRLPSTR